MKRAAFCLGILLLATAVSQPAQAACSPGQPLVNASTGFQSNLSAPLGTNTLVRFWELGNSAGANSGTLPQGNIAQSYGSGYFLSSDWGNTGVVGCPSAAPTARSITLYTDVNLAGAATVPRFTVMSIARTSGIWNYDTITNGPGNVCPSRPHPAINIDSLTPLAGNTFDVALNWPAMNNLRGFFDVNPGVNVITGVAIYFRNFTNPQVADTLAEFQRSGWTLASGGPNARAGFVSFPGAGVDPGTQIVNIPRPVAGTTTFLAIAVLFDGQTPASAIAQTSFVGPASSGITESGAIFSAISAIGLSGGNVKVDWTSGIETNVVSYEVYWSRKQAEPFVLASGQIPPTGDGSTYTHTFNPVTKTGVVLVKVKANLNGGGAAWSPVVSVQLAQFTTAP